MSIEQLDQEREQEHRPKMSENDRIKAAADEARRRHHAATGRAEQDRAAEEAAAAARDSAEGASRAHVLAVRSLCERFAEWATKHDVPRQTLVVETRKARIRGWMFQRVYRRRRSQKGWLLGSREWLQSDQEDYVTVRASLWITPRGLIFAEVKAGDTPTLDLYHGRYEPVSDATLLKYSLTSIEASVGEYVASSGISWG